MSALGRKSAAAAAVLIIGLVLGACSERPGDIPPEKPAVPRGYVDRLEIAAADRMLSFGPFVGYYFKPASRGDFEGLDFVCFNERSFYTRDLPANAPLFEGRAVWRELPEGDRTVPPAGGARIVPVFFGEAPVAWRDTRPEPREEYRHFHSAYDARGAVRWGYWLRHVALARFTYDMGGRVTEASPLYHEVRPGPDLGFAQIIEFDHGPER
jgi:hypothetical protein